MDKENTVEIIISILSGLDYTNNEILIRQLTSCNDLLETVALELNNNKDKECEHPEDSRHNMTTMGDKEQTFFCKACGELIKIDKEENNG